MLSTIYYVLSVNKVPFHCFAGMSTARRVWQQQLDLDAGLDNNRHNLQLYGALLLHSYIGQSNIECSTAALPKPRAFADPHTGPRWLCQVQPQTQFRNRIPSKRRTCLNPNIKLI